MLEVSTFGGIAPKIAPHLLPPGAAAENVNVIPVDGNLRAVGAPVLIATADSPPLSLAAADGPDGRVIHGWTARGVSVVPVAGEFRYAAADARNGARLWAAGGADFEPPENEWALGIPKPFDMPASDASGEGNLFYAVSFFAEWGGLIYESALSPPRFVGEQTTDINWHYDSPSLNSAGVSAVAAETGGWRFTTTSRLYVRPGERAVYEGLSGRVISAAADEVVVVFDDPHFSPDIRAVDFLRQDGRLTVAPTRWSPLGVENGNSIAATLAPQVDGDSRDFTFSAFLLTTAEHTTPINANADGDISLARGGRYRVRAAASSGAEFNAVIEAQPPALGGRTAAFAFGDAIMV